MGSCSDLVHFSSLETMVATARCFSHIWWGLLFTEGRLSTTIQWFFCVHIQATFTCWIIWGLLHDSNCHLFDISISNQVSLRNKQRNCGTSAFIHSTLTELLERTFLPPIVFKRFICPKSNGMLHCYLRHWRCTDVMFSAVCLGISKSFLKKSWTDSDQIWWTGWKFGTRTNRFDFWWRSRYENL